MRPIARRLHRLEDRLVPRDDPEAARLVALLRERMRRYGLPCDDAGADPSRAHQHRTIIEVLRARFEKPKATDNTE
jgi:hypothetical protein